MTNLTCEVPAARFDGLHFDRTLHPLNRPAPIATIIVASYVLSVNGDAHYPAYIDAPLARDYTPLASVERMLDPFSMRYQGG